MDGQDQRWEERPRGLEASSCAYKRRNLGEPSSLFDFEEVTNNNHNQEPPPQNGPPLMVKPNGNSIHSFDDMMRKFLSKYFPPSLRDTINAATGGTFMQKTQEECYELIENMTAHHNHWNTSAIQDETSRNISSTTESPKVVRQLEMMNKNFSEMIIQFQMVKAVDTKWETCGGPLSFTECSAIGGYTQETTYATTDLKAFTTQSGVTLAGPSVSPPLSKEVDRELETITDQVLTGSTNNIPPLVVQPSPASTSFSTISSSKVLEVTKDTLCEKDDTLALKFVEIFRNLHFSLSFADALLHMPKFALIFKSLLNNKEKLFDLAMTLVNENCWAVILKKLPEKLGDPSKFLIPCDFPEFNECLALADLGASINLMPLSIWKKLSLPEHTSTQMILELADRSTTRPADIAKDVFLTVGKRALIDVYGEELTLRVDDEAITFKVGQTLKYSFNDAESINRIDVIDVACEEYVQEVLGFSDNSKSGNPTQISDPIIALSSPSLTPFKGGDFILEEIEACLTSKSIPPGINDTDLDLKGDIHLLEEFLNNYPSLSPLPPKELNVEEIKTVKSSIDEPPKLDLKELPPHLEYTNVYTNHSAHKYLLAKQDAKPRWLWWILLLQEFDVIIRDNKGAENLAVDHLSRLKNPHQDELEKKEITETFPLEFSW
uniref:Reverse transcriptase domain-containing protein n=1 Tax=Tanacetum cinerariifolium TaxID=118510 RepID=A0A6L2MND8_TANCI|nr:reverse transcriptase domain-containing protein [Tanacetum cinerariifolium]